MLNYMDILKVISRNSPEILEKAFKEKLSLEPQEKRELNDRLYGPSRGSQKFLKAQILPLFELYHSGIVGITKYQEYRKVFFQAWGAKRVLYSIAHFIDQVALPEEKASEESVMTFAREKGALWWQHRVLWTVWEGKTKELVFGLKLKRALPEQYNLRKPTEYEDKTYMLDFIIELNGTVKLGISVKSESYARNKSRGTSSWLNSKESTEERGHKYFEEKFSTPVLISISSLKDNDLVKDEIDDVLYFLEHEEERRAYEVVSSPADSPWMTMSGAFEELEF